MKKVLLKSALLPLALLFGAGAATAASDQSFDDLDTNGDGSLSAEEVRSADGIELESADSNGDGALDEDEFKAAKDSQKGDSAENALESDQQGMEEPTTD